MDIVICKSYVKKIKWKLGTIGVGKSIKGTNFVEEDNQKHILSRMKGEI